MSAAATKLPYRSAWQINERVISEPGSRMQPTYGYVINSKGQKVLEQTGEEDLYAKIQSSAEEVKIENILKQVAVGDFTHFRPDGIYQDISEIPNNLIDAKREMQKLENMWNTLPNEIKNKYDNSVEVFIAEAGKESWLLDTGLIQPKEVEAPVSLEPETTVETPKETN